MVGLIVNLFAMLISNGRPKDNEDNLSFILLIFSIIFVMFSPVIATMTVSTTNIFLRPNNIVRPIILLDCRMVLITR